MHAHDRPSRGAAPRARKTAAPGDLHGLLALQRSIGNEAVTALLRAEEQDVHDEGRGHDARVQRAAIDRALGSPGRPLGEGTLAKKETQFQADFSGVRVHTGPAAAQAAAAVQARAFTVHQDIVLGARGDDPEVLDHELTHVVRNQQGATAGHDTGGGFDMTHPNDPAEQEASSNAARMRSGRQSAVVGGSPSVARTPVTPAAVQRWAFVAGQQITPDTDGLTPEMKKFAEDTQVRDYRTDREFREHAEGRLDYLGNLPGPASAGTWVRFSPTGINIIGEDHTAVTLANVLTAVGSRSFIYEPFVTENLSDEKNTEAAYRKELSPFLSEFGMAQDADWTPHGAESFYPKLGHAMAQLLEFLLDQNELPKLRKNGEHQHLGRQFQRYLKIAWQYGKDMREQPEPAPSRAALVAEYQRVKHPDNTIAKARSAFGGGLNNFINNLSDDGYLGDELRKHTKYTDPLTGYVRALIDELRERGAGDTVAPTTRAGVPAGEPLRDEHKKADLARRRNLHFRAAVRKALDEHVRYAGMGKDHYDVLFTGDKNSNWHFFDMRVEKIREFETLTEQRRNQAQAGTAG